MNYLLNTPCGPIEGRSTAPGIMAFKGIRYATAGRWEYPKLVTEWDGVYDATAYGNCSYQARAFYDEELNKKKYFYYNEFRKGASYTYSEDCLFLNVFAPDTAREGSNLPVLVYIHGGGFTGGCGHEKHFDAPIWPTRGIVGVTLNYRLGPLGFLTLPELEAEAGCTGNYGLYDQLAALQWIRANISAFGGDPDNITIMGQSAGAMSVQQHCLSPLTDGLFHRAIMSSGGGVSKMMVASKPEKNYDFWHAVMERAGCATLEEFRALDPEILFGVWDEAKKEIKGGGMACSPVMDGRFVVGSGVDLLKAGKHKQISYMAGSNSHDLMPPILHSMAYGWCAAQRKPSYCWYFSRQLPGDEAGAWHSSDLWYWFGTLGNGWRPFTLWDHKLSSVMVDYLTNFVKTGNPNGENLPKWDCSCKKNKKAMTFGDDRVEMAKPSLLNMIRIMLTNKAVGE